MATDTFKDGGRLYEALKHKGGIQRLQDACDASDAGDREIGEAINWAILIAETRGDQRIRNLIRRAETGIRV